MKNASEYDREHHAGDRILARLTSTSDWVALVALQRRSRQSAAKRALERGDLAAIVATRRQELGLSQTELGDLAGVSYRIVHHLESGRADTSLKRLLAVLETLGLHLTIERGAEPDVRASREMAAQYKLAPDAAPPAGTSNETAP